MEFTEAESNMNDLVSEFNMGMNDYGNAFPEEDYGEEEGA